ncbi:diguanylate cyclase [Amorphus suaedae]
MFDIFIPLLQNTGMLALVAVSYGFLLPRVHGLMADVCLGLLFGLGASLSMLSPVELTPGILVDSRASIVILAGVFGGPVAALIAGGVAGACRLAGGGVGLAAGLVGIAISIGIGVAAHCIARARARGVGFRHIAMAALASPAVGLGVLLLPWDVARAIVIETAIPVALARILGILFLGSIMLDHHRRISAEERVRKLAYLDELSGLANRRSFYAHLTKEWKRWERYSQSFIIVLLDIDEFKRVNDSFGHPAGDLVIQHIGRVMLEESRGSDLVARTGGEEFGLLMPHTTSASGYTVAERIRARAEREVVMFEGQQISVTVSLSVSADPGSYRSMSKLLLGTDRALYEAKARGRNTVVVDTPEAGEPFSPKTAPQPATVAGRN